MGFLVLTLLSRLTFAIGYQRKQDPGYKKHSSQSLYGLSYVFTEVVSFTEMDSLFQVSTIQVAPCHLCQ